MMAMKTFFSDDEMAQVLTQYTAGHLQAIAPISAGTVQTNVLLTTTQGQFVLKYYENRSHKSVLFEAYLLHYLKKRAFPCVAPLPQQNGKSVGTLRGKAYMLYPFMAGKHLTLPTRTQQQRIVRLAAQLQTLTSSYRPHYEAHRWNYSPQLCHQLVHATAAKNPNAQSQTKLAWFEQQLNALNLPKTLPKAICHCDYELPNLLFTDNSATADLIALLDFDDANRTYRTFDLVFLLDMWSWSDGIFDLARARDIVYSYQQTRPLSALEKAYIFEVHHLKRLFEGVWFFHTGDLPDLHAKRAIDHLNTYGKAVYSEALFG